MRQTNGGNTIPPKTWRLAATTAKRAAAPHKGTHRKHDNSCICNGCINNVSRGTLPSKTHAGRAGIAGGRQCGGVCCLPDVVAKPRGRAGSTVPPLRRLEAIPALPATLHRRKVKGIIVIYRCFYNFKGERKLNYYLRKAS